MLDLLVGLLLTQRAHCNLNIINFDLVFCDKIDVIYRSLM